MLCTKIIQKTKTICHLGIEMNNLNLYNYSYYSIIRIINIGHQNCDHHLIYLTNLNTIEIRKS